MRVLLTGFEPFGGSSVNPSQLVVERLVAEHARAGALRPGRAAMRLEGLVLPVDDVEGPRRLIDAVDRLEPGAVICLGESARARAVMLERVFINLRDYAIADNAGRRITDQPIERGGPAAYFSTLPLRAIAARIDHAGVAAAISNSAGAFLCNHVAYALLHHLHERGGSALAGFIHLPRLPEQGVAGSGEGAPMSLELMCRAVDNAIDAVASAVAGPSRGSVSNEAH